MQTWAGSANSSKYYRLPAWEAGLPLGTTKGDRAHKKICRLYLNPPSSIKGKTYMGNACDIPCCLESLVLPFLSSLGTRPKRRVTQVNWASGACREVAKLQPNAGRICSTQIRANFQMHLTSSHTAARHRMSSTWQTEEEVVIRQWSRME